MRWEATVERLSAAPGVVLGLGQNGLATVRALARQGVPVIGLDRRLDQPTARTRLCLRIPYGAMGRREELLPALLALGLRLPQKGVLFPSGDLSLQVVSEHREALAPYYHVRLPARETVRLILDKVAFYAWARERGFPIPATHVLGPEGPGVSARDVTYPAILKPHLRDAAWRAQGLVKAYPVHSPEDLQRRWDALPAGHGAMVLQEYIPGPDSQLAFSLTYLDGRGEPLAWFTGRKLRQFPPRLGTSSMAESRWDVEVAQVSLALLEALGYEGYASVEFKRDPRDGQLRIIEVTGRTWYPHGLATHCGVNLPWLAYCELLGRPVVRPWGFPDGVKWIDEDRDLRSALAYRAQGELPLREWLASYRGRRTYALAAWDDPGPLLCTVGRWIRSGLGAMRGWRPRRAGRAPVAAPRARPGAPARPPAAVERGARVFLERAFHVAKRRGVPGLDFGECRMAAIVRYHSVSSPGDGHHLYAKPSITHTPDVFARHMAVLAARYRCVNMEDVLEALDGGRPLPPNAVVITFDDGYRDNYEHAYPILRRYGLSATFYLTTGCLDGAHPLWTAELRYLVHRAPGPVLTDPMTGHVLGLHTPSLREAAITRLKDGLIGQPRAVRADVLRELGRLTGADLGWLRGRFLRWSEVAEMARGGMHVGAHTVTHPLLPLMPREEAWREIADSRSELAGRLGRAIVHFSYPNPTNANHVSPSVRRLVKQAGFASAVTSEQGYVQPGDEPFNLARVAVGSGPWRIPWDLERDLLRALPSLPPRAAERGAGKRGGEGRDAVALLDRVHETIRRERAHDLRMIQTILQGHADTVRDFRRVIEATEERA